ncbi:hypothetical protein F5876DRAFT_78948 [Lentinula aff. lateritia]|uniref:Uncharacterized protein n=1 Tax=Lentinula aff. lateritia TaxID=2804960 RepID=A0ACC1TU43_9AGAR|nr:hypothetical protein F5876DRAFT_78948 [Lentinula aff. lateritia]
MPSRGGAPEVLHLYSNQLSSPLIPNEADARLVGDFFERAAAKKLCSASAFEEGFLGIAEILDDIAIDAPKATDFLAIMIMKAADLGKEQWTNIASKSAENGDKLLELSS